MPVFARLVMVAAGAGAIVAGRYHYRIADDLADDARRLGVFPRLNGASGHRVGGAATVVAGVVFVLLGLFAGW